MLHNYYKKGFFLMVKSYIISLVTCFRNFSLYIVALFIANRVHFFYKQLISCTSPQTLFSNLGIIIVYLTQADLVYLQSFCSYFVGSLKKDRFSTFSFDLLCLFNDCLKCQILKCCHCKLKLQGFWKTIFGTSHHGNCLLIDQLCAK